MKRKKLDMTPICDKCGKTAPINKAMSSENWIVYEVKAPCECGGRFMARAILEARKAEEAQ